MTNILVLLIIISREHARMRLGSVCGPHKERATERWTFDENSMDTRQLQSCGGSSKGGVQGWFLGEGCDP